MAHEPCSRSPSVPTSAALPKPFGTRAPSESRARAVRRSPIGEGHFGEFGQIVEGALPRIRVLEDRGRRHPARWHGGDTPGFASDLLIEKVDLPDIHRRILH